MACFSFGLITLYNCLRIVYRCHSIFAIRICSNGICILLSEHCSAYHDFYPRALSRSCLMVSSMLGTVVVIRALKPTNGTWRLTASSTTVSGGTSFQDRSHRSCSFQKNLYDVLSNVMDIAFDSCKDNGTFLFLGLSAACHGILITSKAALAASALINSCGRKTVPFSKPFPTWSSAGMISSLITSRASFPLKSSYAFYCYFF